MSREYRLEIRPDGDQMQIIVRGPDQAQVGNELKRQTPTLDAAKMDAFRRGDAQLADIEALTQGVSDWLLAPDLNPIVKGWLAANGGGRVRLVFSIAERLLPRLGDVPLELARTDAASDHLSIHTGVENFLHLLSKVGARTISPDMLDWPMRILFVRSNPTDLGDRVPPAAPLRDEILTRGSAAFGPRRIEVDLLSAEPGAVGRPTWEVFRRTVRAGYHILIYLGHGDVQQLHQDSPPVSHLQFETADGVNHEPVTSKQLANVLHEYAVPVVVLAGCLTAAVPGAAPGPVDVMANLPTWMRGNQGMAQALVNSEAGVLLAVGMRSQIDGAEIVGFLREFFDSLFTRDRGNVEMAVRAARLELFQRHPHPPSWAAPMVFSALVPEPLFPYLKNDLGIAIEVTRDLSLELAARRYLWPLLADTAPANRTAALTKAVNDNRAAISTEVLKQGAMLLPELVDAAANTTVRVPVTLEGAVVFRRLNVKLATTPPVTVVKARLAKALADVNYQILADPDAPEVVQIQVKHGAAAPAVAPPGVVVEFELNVPADAQGVLPVNLELLDTDANRRLWAGNNAVIVARA